MVCFLPSLSDLLLFSYLFFFFVVNSTMALGWWWCNIVDQRCRGWFQPKKKRNERELLVLTFFFVGLRASLRELGTVADWMVNDGWVFMDVRKKEIGLYRLVSFQWSGANSLWLVVNGLWRLCSWRRLLC